MEKNYYDILQINQNASPEIIEKAYKVLAKKYHPDLQSQEDKQQAEDILKEINEAYEVLSNSEKKATYDARLLEKEQNAFNLSNNQTTSNYASNNNSIPYEEARKEELFRQQQEQLQREQELAYQEQLQREQNLAYEQQMQQARAKAYHDAYIQDLKNRGYKIRYKKSLKDYIRGIVSIVVVVLVLFLLCQLPFVKAFLARLYEENELIHGVVTFFRNVFK